MSRTASLLILALSLISSGAKANVEPIAPKSTGTHSAEQSPPSYLETPPNSRACPKSLEEIEEYRKHMATSIFAGASQFYAEVAFYVQCLEGDLPNGVLNKNRACMKNFLLLDSLLLSTFANAETNKPTLEVLKVPDSSFIPLDLLKKDYQPIRKAFEIFSKSKDIKKVAKYFETELSSVQGLKVHYFKSEFSEVHGNNSIVLEYKSRLGVHLLNIDLGKETTAKPVLVNAMLLPQVDGFSSQAQYLVTSSEFEKNKETGKINLSKMGDFKLSQETGCQQCHFSGYIPIRTNFQKSEGIEDLNKRGQKLRSSDYGDSYLNSGLPLFGDLSDTTDEELKQVLIACLPQAGDFKQEDVVRLKKAMNCATCHDGETAGAINPLVPHIGTIGVYRHSVESGSMPQSSVKLSKEERKKLYDCLQTEFTGIPSQADLDLAKQSAIGSQSADEIFKTRERIKATPRGRLVKWLLEKECR